jgi:DNA-directed RNA polymerase subunit K/omega
MADAEEPVPASGVETAEPAEPITSRFLFVDVAAQRAKQLRRGALPRLKAGPIDPETGHRLDLPRKLERLAMEEVRSGLIYYDLPDAKIGVREGTS